MPVEFLVLRFPHKPGYLVANRMSGFRGRLGKAGTPDVNFSLLHYAPKGRGAESSIQRVFLSEEASSGIYRLRTEKGMSLSKLEGAERILSGIRFSFKPKALAEVAPATGAAKRLHHVKSGALEKQESQMVVKHRTGKPKSGISVFSGSLGASTLLFAFSFLFLLFFFAVVV